MSYPSPEEADLDLGSGVYAKWTGYNQENHPEAPDKCGLVVSFPCALAEDGRCNGALMWWRPANDPGAIWTLHSLDPLTISPSVLTRCYHGEQRGEHHGYIRNGRWEGC